MQRQVCINCSILLPKRVFLKKNKKNYNITITTHMLSLLTLVWQPSHAWRSKRQPDYARLTLCAAPAGIRLFLTGGCACVQEEQQQPRFLVPLSLPLHRPSLSRSEICSFSCLSQMPISTAYYAHPLPHARPAQHLLGPGLTIPSRQP